MRLENLTSVAISHGLRDWRIYPCIGDLPEHFDDTHTKGIRQSMDANKQRWIVLWSPNQPRSYALTSRYNIELAIDILYTRFAYTCIHVSLTPVEIEMWDTQRESAFHTRLLDPSSFFGKLPNILRFELDLEVSLIRITEYLRSRHKQIYYVALHECKYDLPSLIDLFEAKGRLRWKLLLGPPIGCILSLTLDELFTQIDWERYPGLYDLEITVTVPQVAANAPQENEDFGIYKGPPRSMRRLYISFHNHHINSSSEPFDMDHYALPTMSCLAKAMLVLGGPYCEYSLGFWHYDCTNAALLSAERAVTRILNREIQAILSNTIGRTRGEGMEEAGYRREALCSRSG
jgi:hypothetical protein